MSKSIFHYTKKFEYVCDILERGFIPSFCEEELCTKSNCFKFHVPCVCFCDIPLTRAKDHKKKYGEFAIGVKKDWARKNDINPITYLNSESGIADSILSVIKAHKSYINKQTGRKKKQETYNRIRTLSHFKNYKGDVPNHGLKDVEFYEEKEWRYVPTTLDGTGDKCCKFHEESEWKRIKSKYTSKPHLPGCAISVSLTDITHIIVPNKDQKHKFINCLKANDKIFKSKRAFYDLLTKIITYKEIQDDL